MRTISPSYSFSLHGATPWRSLLRSCFHMLWSLLLTDLPSVGCHYCKAWSDGGCSFLDDPALVMLQVAADKRYGPTSGREYLISAGVAGEDADQDSDLALVQGGIALPSNSKSALSRSPLTQIDKPRSELSATIKSGETLHTDLPEKKSSAELPVAAVEDGKSDSNSPAIPSSSALQTLSYALGSYGIYGGMAIFIIGVVLLVLVFAQVLTDSSGQESINSYHYGRSAYESFPGSGAISRDEGHPPYFRSNLPNFQQDRQYFSSYPSSGGGSVAEFVHYPQTSRQSRPPPICRELVTVVDSWFAVSFNGIEAAAGQIPIYGLSAGGQILSADSRKNRRSGQGIVAISVRPGGDALGCIESAGAGPMEIRDGLGTPYGEFIHVGALTFRLTLRAIEVLRLHYDPALGEMLMRSSADGSVLASAKKMANAAGLPPNEEYMQVHVCAGMDPIIALLLIMASLTFNAD